MNNAEADSLDLWNEPIPTEERERLLDSVAEAVRRRGLTTPALFFVEMNRPLGFVASQGIIALAPMLAPLLGLERMQTVGRLLADEKAVDDLVRRLESRPHPPTPSPNSGRGGEGKSGGPEASSNSTSLLPLSQNWERGSGGEGG